MITQKELTEVIHYNPLTGIFTWLIDVSNIKAGSIAGSLDKGTGYIRIKLNNTQYLAHRLAWFYTYNVWPNQIDHEDHIKHHNWLLNLQDVTRLSNSRNLPLRKDNTSGVMGVNWSKVKRKWQAYITVNCKDKHLGFFVDKFEAICTRKSAEIAYNFHKNHGR